MIKKRFNEYFLNLIWYSSDYDKDLLEKEIIEDSKEIKKPCNKLWYCPYGPMVEQFPLLPILKDSAIKHNEHLKDFIAKWEYTWELLKTMQKRVDEFNIHQYPETIPKELKNMNCWIFWHLCPVYFCKENVTDSSKDNIEEEFKKIKQLKEKLWDKFNIDDYFNNKYEN